MTFTTPWALLLLALWPWFAWLGRPGRGAGRGRRQAALVLRLVIVLCLTLALAGARLARRADELAVVFLVDASDSINPAQAAQAEAFVRQAVARLRPPDQAAVVVFGADALVERPLSGLAELAAFTSTPPTLQTDLDEAIRLGLALFPAGSARRLVILSDGAATTGDAAGAARLAAAAGVAVDYAPLTRPPATAEAWLQAVSAPTRAGVGEEVSVTAAVASTLAQPAVLSLLSDGRLVAEQSLQLRPGLNTATLRWRADAPQFARYNVELAPTQDTQPQNNHLAAFTEIVGPPRVLVVAADGPPDEAAALPAALRAAGLAVERQRAGEFSAELSDLSNYAAIILVNVNAAELSPRQMTALQSYVRDLGGGLVAVGGPTSYGMGGYFRTPLEEMLPVDMQIKDSERFPSVSIAIVIDRSGSMSASEGGVTKIQLAAEGAARVVELLNDRDEISVIPVDTQPSQVVGPVSAAEREQVIRRIRAIGAGGGGIYVRTGLQAAAAALADSPNEVKHIILLADGADAEEQEGAAGVVAELTAQGVTLSVVAIGAGPDVPFLRGLAELGGGRFHFTDRAANLPQIFTQETTQIQRSYLIEERFYPRLVTSSAILNGITATPPLYGYVGVSAKATAQTVLVSAQNDPVLAQWQYGLGRAVAWTSDATGRWGRDWVAWEGFPTFWAQAARWTISQGRGEMVETAVTFSAETAHLSVDARNAANQFLNDLSLRANVVAPSGRTQALHLTQTGPGRYSADFTPQAEGAYLIRVADENDQTALAQTTGWVLGYSPEYRPLAADTTAAASLAALTSGRDLSDNPAGVWEHNLTTGRAIRPIGSPLILLAVVLLPLDIAARRLVIPPQAWQRARAALRARLTRRAPAPVTRPAALDRLFEAKQRAAGPTDAPPERPAAMVSPPADDAASAAPASVGAPVEPPARLASRLLDQKRRRTESRENE